MPTTGSNITPSEWKRRRFRLDIVLASLIGWFTYIIVWGPETSLSTVAIPILTSLSALIMQYTGFAVLDDKNRMDAEVKVQVETKHDVS